MGFFLNETTTCGAWCGDPKRAAQIAAKPNASCRSGAVSCVDVGTFNPGLFTDVASRCEERCVQHQRPADWQPTLKEELVERTSDHIVDLAVATRDITVSAAQWTGIYDDYQGSKVKLNELDRATAYMPIPSKIRRDVASLRAREAKIDAAMAGAPGVGGGFGAWQAVAAVGGGVTLLGGLGYAIYRFSTDVLSRWICTRSLDKIPPNQRVQYMDTCKPESGTPWYADVRILGGIAAVGAVGWFFFGPGKAKLLKRGTR